MAIFYWLSFFALKDGGAFKRKIKTENESYYHGMQFFPPAILLVAYHKRSQAPFIKGSRGCSFTSLLVIRLLSALGAALKLPGCHTNLAQMGKQPCEIIAPVALLLLGILGILLLAIPTNDLKEPPEYMVKPFFSPFSLRFLF